MARRSQCSSAGDNPLDPNYLPPHYREEYRLAIDALVENSLDGYYQLLQNVDVVDFLSPGEIDYIQSVVQPPKQSIHPEQQFLDSEGEGSSDTYWPIHSDLDVPGLDLGWPQVHHFIEPTEVTTLVNPPEPDMPSIKEQARRLIKNAQQVIAIVMDIFTDVDIFADILNAAGRRVAVYILLDEHNADLFFNMVVNCRVNLQAFPFIRVRTVSGITYQCRSGKTFKGQMMDRFLLTDCRAVLSGNYSFMWSFEKLHRCMAHLFLGQLVTTFDEEFRILFAQSQPLNVENMHSRIEDSRVLHKRQFPNESTSMYREPRRFLSLDAPSDDWGGHSYDEHAGESLRIVALKRHGSLRGPADMYNRYGSQQALMDPGFDQGPARILMTDNPALKRHSYAEDVPGRYSLPFLQQPGMSDSEPRGKLFHREQQLFPGPEEEYSSYDKFWNQGYMQGEQFPVPGLQQEVLPPEFDPVLNYLSSTRNLDLDQGSDRLLPPADLPFTSSHSKQRGVRQPYVGQTSPTSSNSDQKPFFHDPNMNRKDPTVKKKLRNWRIGSYLSAYDNPEEEGLPMEPSQQPDAFEEPVVPIQQTAPVADFPSSKIPNVKEFKVTTVPRISQMPSYIKAATQEKPKTVLAEPASVTAETKNTATLPETSSMAEGKKNEEEDPKRTKNTRLQRDDSFRKRFNAAMRSSRLRSSLIFSSLDQQNPQETTTADQEDEESDKGKTEQTKLPLVSHVLGQRRSVAREPIEWSRYIKPTSEALKTDKDEDKDSSRGKDSQDLAEMPEGKEPLKHTDVEQDSVSPLMPEAKLTEAAAPKTDQPVQPTKPLLTYVDMNDPDNRLMFFKELAAKRKAAKASEAQKEKEKVEVKPHPEPKTTSVFQKKEPLSKGTPETSVATDSVKMPAVVSEKTSKTDCNTPKTANERKTETKKTEMDPQSMVSLSLSAETDQPASKPSENQTLSNPSVKESLSPVMPQSKPVKAELPKIDQVEQLTNPLLAASSYVDMSDPDDRLKFFKELAAKRKASAAKTGKEQDQKEPLTESQNTSVCQKEQNPPPGTLESTNPSVRQGLSVKNTISLVTSNSASSLLKSDETTRKKDSLVKSDSNTLNTSKEQASKITAETVKTDLEKQSAEETETSQSKSLEHSTVSEPSVENKSPKQANAADATVSSCVEVADKREHLSLETVPAFPSSMEGLTSSDPQNTESFQQETNICSPPLPSRGETTPLKPPEHISTSDSPPPDSGMMKQPVTAKQTLPSDSAQKVYSPTIVTITPPPNVDEIKPQQESSKEPLETSDSQHNQTLEAVPQLEKSNVSLDEETNREETAAVTPSVGGFRENNTKLEQEESVSKECEALESPDDPKADSASLPVCPSTLDSSFLCESGPEGSVSEQPMENIVLSTTASGDTQPKVVPTETRSDGNQESCNISPLEKAELPQDTPIQNAHSSYLKLTDLNAPSVAETALSTSMSELDQSVMDPKTEISQIASVVQNLADTSSVSNETQPQSKESSQSLSEPTMVAPAEVDLSCKASEAVSPESQTAEPPTESRIKEPESVEVDEEKSNNLPDKDRSQEPSMEDSANREKSKDKLKQSNNSETTEVTSNETKSKSEESVDQPTTRSSEEYTMVAPTKPDLVCKASESVSPESQTAETPVPQESSKKEPELVEADEKKPSSLLDKDTSQKPSTDEGVGREQTKEESKQSNVSETTEVTSNETQPKSEESVDQSTTQSQSKSTMVTPAEADLTCNTSEKVNLEIQTPETPVSQESNKKEKDLVETDEKKSNSPLDKDKSQKPSTEEPLNKEKTKDESKHSNDSETTDVTSKQPKSSQSRYHSSTVNVISSSNLRDDTKLLLGQISANSQSRNESTKDSPVTDDEKEDKADKKAKNEKGLGYRMLNRGSTKSDQEREQLLEKIQTMRKTRRVYSRFEMAP